MPALTCLTARTLCGSSGSSSLPAPTVETITRSFFYSGPQGLRHTRTFSPRLRYETNELSYWKEWHTRQIDRGSFTERYRAGTRGNWRGSCWDSDTFVSRRPFLGETSSDEWQNCGVRYDVQFCCSNLVLYSAAQKSSWESTQWAREHCALWWVSNIREYQTYPVPWGMHKRRVSVHHTHGIRTYTCMQA